MLGPLFGTEVRERILIFILARERGYATEIAKFYDVDLYSVQNQLDKLETGGVLVSYKAGRTRLYEFNPRYAFLSELTQLLEKALSYYPKDQQDELLLNRRRPRRRGKPQ